MFDCFFLRGSKAVMEEKTRKIILGTLTFHTQYFGNEGDPTCLLIAGAMAPGYVWSDAFCQNLVKKGFFVIRYDHRDIGESSAVDWGKTPYTLSDLAKDAIGILDTYGIKQAHFVGHSMGGFICQKIALDFPQYVLSITMISAGPICPVSGVDSVLTPEEEEILDKTWKVFLNRKGGDTLEELIKNFLPVWKHLNGKFLLNKEMINTYTRNLLTSCGSQVLAGNNHERVMSSLGKGNNLDAIQNIQVPALIIHGDQDPLVLPRNGRALSLAIPKSELIMIPGMGHVFFNRELELKIVSLIVQHMKKVKIAA